ncbi:unnamed protein product [Phytophthora fragariaefolia]|uniref:Unnamed protein product n=1 Tax=Phytophthora fragariaefolia TaxID=1490495 RepID=A0A9W7CQW9_9STRA|nr:unnamed protein product [Phytophthora fragariaefolia]
MAGSRSISANLGNLQDAFATRDDAIRGQEEVAALLFQQTQGLHAAEQHLAAYHAELGRLHAEMSNLRGQVDLTGVISTRIQGPQDQTAYQLGDIQDLERRLTRMTRERDRLQASNDHLAAEMDLAGTEILDLQTEYADIERDLENSEEQRRILEIARMELSDLQGSLQSFEETVDALGQRVREIQDQRQAAEQDREDLRLRHEAACRERDTARRQLSMTPPPKNVDPYNLPDPSKRPREDSNTPDPNSVPLAKRRFASQDSEDTKDDHSLSDPANQGGEIDDDGGRISEDHEVGGDSVSDEATTNGEAGSSAGGKIQRQLRWQMSSSRLKP